MDEMTPQEARRLLHGRLREKQNEAAMLEKIVAAFDVVIERDNLLHDIEAATSIVKAEGEQAVRRLDEYEAQIAQYTLELESYQQAVKDLRAERDGLSQEIAADRAARVAALETDMATLRHELKQQHEAEVRMLQQSLTQHKQELMHLQGEVEQQQQMLRAIMASVSKVVKG